MNTARSALSSVTVLAGDVPIRKHPLVCRFLKEVFQERPALPHYVDTGDVSLVVNYLKDPYPPENLGLKELTQKSLFYQVSGRKHYNSCVLRILPCGILIAQFISVYSSNTLGQEFTYNLSSCQSITIANCVWFIRCVFIWKKH